MTLDDIEQKFPFITVAQYGDKEYVGVMINQDQHITSMYVYETLKSEDEKRRILELAEIWWWESNRMIPINIFLRKEMEPFRYSIVSMNSKDVEITMGPIVSLSRLSSKRTKRKSIILVRKPKI